MIHVIATVQLQPGSEAAFLEQFRAIVPDVLRETGCLEYGPTRDVNTSIAAQGGVRQAVVTVVEKWENLACLEAHLVAPHMLAYRQKVKDLVRSTSLQILEPA